MSHHSCLCAPSLRCLSCLGEYGLNLVRVLFCPSCLPKSRDEIFLRGRDCHDPGKKKKRKRKSRPGPTCQPLTLLLLCFPPRAAARVVVGVHPRLPRHVPVIVESRAAPSLFPRPSPYPRQGRPRSPSTLTLALPLPPLPPLRAPPAAAIRRRR